MYKAYLILPSFGLARLLRIKNYTTREFAQVTGVTAAGFFMRRHHGV